MTVKTQKSSSKPGIFSVRNRLLGVVILALIVPVIITQFVGVTTTQAALKKQVDHSFYNLTFALSEGISRTLVGEVNALTTLASGSTLQQVVMTDNALYPADPDDIQAALLENDEIWQAANAANTNTTLVQRILGRQASNRLRRFQNDFPAHLELFITDAHGGLVAATDRTSDYYQGDEGWWLAAWNQGQGAIYIDNQVEFDAGAGRYSVVMAVPIRDSSGQAIGVLRSTYDIAGFQALIEQSQFGQTGRTQIVDRNAQVLIAADLDPAGQNTLPEMLPLLDKFYDPDDGELDVITGENGERVVVAAIFLSSRGTVPAVEALGWYAVIQQNEDEVFKPVNDSLNSVLRAVAIVLALGLIVAYGLTLTLTRPLNRLAATAQQLAAAEDFSVRTTVTGRDEFGVLGRAFNTMTERLQELFGTLEERVAARTRDLAAVAEVSAQTSTILDVQQLLLAVCNLTKERFNLYHAHIYLLDETGENLTLVAGAGEAGRQMVATAHRIPLSRAQSLVAGAARSRGVVSVDDVSAAPDFLPHPLLPDTRSELAVALVARDQLLGVLDVQSEHVAHFGPETRTVMETLARQVAAALSNVRLFSEVDRISRHEQALGAITQSIQGAVNLEEVLQVATRELGKALRVPYTAIELQLQSTGVHSPDAVDELAEQAELVQQ